MTSDRSNFDIYRDSQIQAYTTIANFVVLMLIGLDLSTHSPAAAPTAARKLLLLLAPTPKKTAAARVLPRKKYPEKNTVH
jgi:hypothetical protein